MSVRGALALVGAPLPTEKPYWKMQAADITQRYRHFDRPLLHDWERTVKEHNIRTANERLDKIRAQFKFGSFLINNTHDEAVNDYANAKSLQCIKALRKWPMHLTNIEAARIVSALMWQHKLEFDFLELERKGELDVMLRKIQDAAWWRKKIRRVAAQRIEAISRELGYINQAKSIYASDLGKAEFNKRKQMNLEMMEATVMENDVGDRYTLADLAALSTANPLIRRTELMVRIAGFEKYAKELGYKAYFLTITCPSKYHAHGVFGVRNEKFNGASQREAQQYLRNLWARFRSLAGRITQCKPEKWEFFGFRVAEPHHDATPHWHLLLFINPRHADAVVGALREYALKVDRYEAGAQKARFKAEKIKTGINPETGREYSAAGYIAKYIAKNVDGEHVDVDHYGENAKASAVAIATWASRNGIRQFQQVGGPSVTAWRELRRIGRMSEEQLANVPPLLRAASAAIEKLNAETASDAWAWYCRFADENGISLWKIARVINETMEAIMGEEIDHTTGEIFQIKQNVNMQRPVANFYGEIMEETHGIKAGAVKARTRYFRWQLVALNREEAAAIRAQRKAEKAEREKQREAKKVLQLQAQELQRPAGPPWTCVNNCTGPGGPQIDTNQMSFDPTIIGAGSHETAA